MTTKGTLIVIMQSLQQRNEILQQLLKAKSTNINAGKSHNFEKYDLKEEEFSTYLERFENYLEMRDIGSNPSADDDELSEAERKQSNLKKKTILLRCLQGSEFLISSLNSERRNFKYFVLRTS